MPIGTPTPDATILQAHAWYVAKPERRLSDTAAHFGTSKSTLENRFKRLGLEIKPKGAPPPRVADAAIRAAHEWYMARPERRLCDVAQRFSLHENTVGAHFKRLGLAAKPAGGIPGVRGGGQHRMTYHEVLEAYRAGATVDELGMRFALATRVRDGLCRDGRDVCADGGVMR